MKVTTQWPIGQFLTTVTATIADEQIGAALTNALKHEGQRCTDIDVVLGGFETGADGKKKRKADYKRGAVEYTDDLALALADAMKKFIESPEGKDDAGNDIPSLFTEVEVEPPTKYEGGAVEVKYAAEKKAVGDYLTANDGKLKSGEPRTVASFCANRGIEEPTVEDYKEDTAFLTAVKAWLKSVAVQE